MYQNADGTGAETTSYAYTYFSGTAAIEQETASLPAVTDQNSSGTGVTDTLTAILNTEGQAVWQQDANGNISYTAYDPVTGAVVEQIQDVSAAEASAGSACPTASRSPAAAI